MKSMLTITEEEFKLFANYIKSNYGIHLKENKISLLVGRLQKVLIQEGFDNFSDYYKHLISDKTGQAVTTLIDKITTNYTYFMRETTHFYYFRDKVLPQLTSTIKDNDLRVWSAACSTGEEAYTLAMIIDEFFGIKKTSWDTKILATDISEKVLKTAQRGIYSKERIDPLPSAWKFLYFEKYDDENYIISNKIKNEVIFRKFNLVEKEFPFKRKFHTIFCRNVMIYFDNETKAQLVDKFYDYLEVGGYLFIGQSESISREASKFRYIMPSVYQKV